MPLKTKVLTVLILLLLIVPVIYNPVSSGNVLGVIEERTDEANQFSQPNLNIDSAQNGHIAGGVMENKSVPAQNTNNTVAGEAVWDSAAKSAVTTDKFNLGAGIKVSHEGKTMNLVVGDTSKVLSDNVILVMDKDTFKELGGDPDIQNSITVEVERG